VSPADRFTRPVSNGMEACRRYVNDARRTCYAQLLSDRLTKHGLADAVATLDAITHADADAAEHAHEYAHGMGIEPTGCRPTFRRRLRRAATAIRPAAGTA